MTETSVIVRKDTREYGTGKPQHGPYYKCIEDNYEIFDTMQEAKVLIEKWRCYYNTIRPHSALEYRPPAPEIKVVDISLKM